VVFFVWVSALSAAFVSFSLAVVTVTTPRWIDKMGNPYDRTDNSYDK
jgi:hypothetical protein